MNHLHTSVAEVLIDIEFELRRLRLWQDQPPPAEAFASSLPFCVDTMDFHQWLQFVLLPKMRALIDNDQPLPASCALVPMAEEAYADQQEAMMPLIQQLRRMDRLFD